MCVIIYIFFFFKQKTAYEMRISDWSSDVCSSDLGTLDDPDLLRPDIHIFTASKQPWSVIPPAARAMPEYYDRAQCWPAESLARRAAILPQIEAHQAARERERAR